MTGRSSGWTVRARLAALALAASLSVIPGCKARPDPCPGEPVAVRVNGTPLPRAVFRVHAALAANGTSRMLVWSDPVATELLAQRAEARKIRAAPAPEPPVLSDVRPVPGTDVMVGVAPPGFDEQRELWYDHDELRSALVAEVRDACADWWLERWRLALALEAVRPELADLETRRDELERLRRSARIEVVRDARSP